MVIKKATGSDDPVQKDLALALEDEGFEINDQADSKQFYHTDSSIASDDDEPIDREASRTPLHDNKTKLFWGDCEDPDNPLKNGISFRGCDPTNIFGSLNVGKDGQYFAVHFEGCQLGVVNFDACSMTNVSFTNYQFRGETSWSNITLEDVEFHDCDFDDFKWQTDHRKGMIVVGEDRVHITEMNDTVPQMSKFEAGLVEENPKLSETRYIQETDVRQKTEEKERAKAEWATKLRSERGTLERNDTVVQKAPVYFDVTASNCQTFNRPTSLTYVGGYFENVRFDGCKRGDVEFKGCCLINVEFINCVFRDTKWVNIYMKDVKVENCVFDDFDWANDLRSTDYLASENHIAEEVRKKTVPQPLLDLEWVKDISISEPLN